MKPQFVYKAIVVRVVDADTIDFTIALGFHMTARVRARIRGINAPEMATPQGRAAAAAVAALLPAGTAVTVQTYPQDKYGRWLADVETPKGDLGQYLLQAGMAVPYMV